VKATRGFRNDEIRVTKLEGITNDRSTNDRDAASLSFVRRASFVIRHSCFVIFAGSVLMLLANVTPAESPNVIGKWNIEITFANAEHRLVRFDARADGKGTLVPADPQSEAWGATTPSEAKWSRGEGNSVTFSGPMEFMIGNVGRDAGTLTFKGKFETPDSIAGEVDFSPLVGERPSKHGTFKAVRTTQ
jgi:hypothetical protein